MPTLSFFHGIKIQMYWNEHPPPHFHASGEGDVVVVEIRTLAILRGDLSPKKLALVLEWAQLHQEELLEAWELCSKLQSPQTITPLP
jgi:hypothetical protein